MARESAREKIMEAACRLFYDRGIRATGIDTVVSESGVTKMTLYKHFTSKEDLVLAALRQRDENWRAWFQSAVEASAESPSERLLAVFDILGTWIASDDFRGCAFLKAAAEYSEVDHPIHREAAMHFERVGLYLRGLVNATDASNPSGLADGLILLIMGAVAIAFATGNPLSAAQARASAEELIRAHGIS